MLGFTDNVLPSNKGVLMHRAFRKERYCNSGEWLYGAARDSAVNRNKNTKFLTSIRRSRSIPHVVRRSAQIGLPCPRPIGHSNIELSFSPKGSLDAGKIVRLQDCQEKKI
jgi:hypothetical protein